MLFTSMEFLFVFLVCTLAGYFLLPVRARNYWLLLVSLFFYAWGAESFVLMMILSIVINYAGALLIQRLGRGTRGSRWALALTLGVDLAILFVYKYMNFITGTLNGLFPSAGIHVTEFILQIGRAHV